MKLYSNSYIYIPECSAVPGQVYRCNCSWIFLVLCPSSLTKSAALKRNYYFFIYPNIVNRITIIDLSLELVTS